MSNASVQLRATGGHTTIGHAANLDVESLLGREDVAEVVESKARAIADDRWASVAANLADGAELAQSSQSVELIAAAVAQIVIGDALVDSVSRWASLVDGVAQSIERTEPATLKVHPDAVDTVREAMADRAAWHVEADASLAYSDVAVETEQGAVVGTMQERIARLVQAARTTLSGGRMNLTDVQELAESIRHADRPSRGPRDARRRHGRRGHAARRGSDRSVASSRKAAATRRRRGRRLPRRPRAAHAARAPARPDPGHPRSPRRRRDRCLGRAWLLRRVLDGLGRPIDGAGPLPNVVAKAAEQADQPLRAPRHRAPARPRGPLRELAPHRV